MTDATPNHRDADDAHADDAPPTDAVSDEVKEDAAHTDLPRGDDNESFPQGPSITHP
jgi:hypothetical protein